MSQSAVRASVLTTDGSEDEGLAAEAKEVIDRYLQPGLGAERSVEAYDSSSDKYDQVSIKLRELRSRVEEYGSSSNKYDQVSIKLRAQELCGRVR